MELGPRSLPDRQEGAQEDLIGILEETPYEEFDRWDDRTLRDWMLQHTSNEGLIALWEFITVLEAITEELVGPLGLRQPLHAQDALPEKRMAGYSFWPGQGWDGMWADLRDGRDGERRRGADCAAAPRG